MHINRPCIWVSKMGHHPQWVPESSTLGKNSVMVSAASSTGLHVSWRREGREGWAWRMHFTEEGVWGSERQTVSPVILNCLNLSDDVLFKLIPKIFLAKKKMLFIIDCHDTWNYIHHSWASWTLMLHVNLLVWGDVSRQRKASVFTILVQRLGDSERTGQWTGT